VIRTVISLLDGGIIKLGFENTAWQEKLFLQFLMPLLAEICRCDDQKTASTLRPFLREHQPGLNGFAQAHFVRKNSAFGQWRGEREKRRFDLMGVQVDLSIHERAGELFHIVRSAALGQLVGDILGMIIR
jgi:hypothetical protein